MPTAYLLHGYIGAGKTTFAKKLEQEIGAVRFTHDDWMVKLYGDNPSPEMFAEYCSRVSDVMEQMWSQFLHHKIDVILDCGFWSRESRDQIRQKFSDMNIDHVLFHLTCDDEMALKRVRARNETSEKTLYIEDNTYYVLKERFENLGLDEPHQIVSTDRD